MKTKLILPLFAIFCSLAAQVSYGQQLSGSTLSLGTLNTLNSSTPGNFAVGTQNQVSNTGAGAIGNYNIVLASDSLALGTANSVGSSGSGSLASMAIGHYNIQNAQNSLVIGNGNELWADAVNGNGVNSIVVGSSNSNIGKQSMIVGWNNHISLVNDAGTWLQPENTAIIGSGLISRFDNCLVIGKNNIGILPPSNSPMPLFIVGNGESTSSRSNALVVDNDGNMEASGVVTAAPGGDVPMYGQ